MAPGPGKDAPTDTNNSAADTETTYKSTPIFTRNDLHLARRLFHFLGGMALIVLPWHLMLNSIRVVFTLLALLEGGRRVSGPINKGVLFVMKPFMRVHELHKPTGSFFFMLGSFIAAHTFPPIIATLTILYLSVGDPVAALVGSQIEIPGFRFPNGKSLHGLAACSVACTCATLVILSDNQQQLSSAGVVLVACVGGVLAGIGETLTVGNLDDNVTLPLLSGAGLLMLLSLWGLSPTDLDLRVPLFGELADLVALFV